MHRPSRSPHRHPVGWVAVTLLGICAILPGCGSSPQRNATDFCATYQDVARQASKVSDPDNLSTSALQKQISTLDDAATDAAKVAPESIAETVDAVIEPLHALRENLDDAKSRAAANRALRQYGAATRKVHAHQQQLDTWVARNCGVVPVTTTSTTLLPRSGTATG